MPRLELRFFGSFAATLEDQPLAGFESDKARGLLAYLAAESDRPHRRELLAALLWPDMPEQKARTNLRRTLANLRKVLGDPEADPPYLLITRQELQFNDESNVWIDISAFQQIFAFRHDPATSTEKIQEATDLARGPFLEGFTVRDSAAFEEWATLIREQLNLQMIDLLQHLAGEFESMGDFEKGLIYARRVLEFEPWREEGHRQVMRLLSMSDHRAAALSQYATCREILARDLGVEPESATTLLYEQILDGEYATSPQLKTSRTVKGYEVRELIGEGHFGVVYRAYQHAIARDVAIKIIQPHFANKPEFIRRFESEAKLVARLEHPHIVPLYDFWREPNGAFLVMRWLRGGSLEDVIRRGPMKAELVVDVIEQIASALATAHRQGVVHRDVKPANILLDESGSAYLTDFGIAKDSLLIETLGTEYKKGYLGELTSYSSPEQQAMKPVGPSSDIFSLGMVIRALITGNHPDRTVGAAGLAPEVQEVIYRATNEEPEKRYADVPSLAAAFREAIGGDGAESSPLTGIDSSTRNPYKGLHSFEEIDAADYFGREELTQRLMTCLRDQQGGSFLSLVGPSGSGKSSIVRAGILPAVRRGELPGSASWYTVEFSPGAHPLEELEVGLLRIAVKQPSGLLGQLKRDSRGLLRAARLVLPDEQSHILLFIDQFEELFTLAEDKGVVDHFMNCLYEAAVDPHSNLKIIITLRGDYYDRPLNHPRFSRLLRENTEVMVPLTPDEMTRAVLQPGENVGLLFEDGLVSSIVSDLSDQPGALPLLQFTLSELFEQRDGSVLTVLDYQTMGGVSGAIGKRADDLFDSLSKSDQQIARQLFIRMVAFREGAGEGPEAHVTRRRVLLSELQKLSIAIKPEVGGKDTGGIMSVIEQFGRHRLLTFDHEPSTREPTVEIAHEALLNAWSRLRSWLDESRSDLQMQRVLSNAVKEWIDSGQNQDYLLSGSKQEQFSAWEASTQLALTQEEARFLEQGESEKRKAEAEEAARLAREAELEKRSANRLRLLAGVMVVATAIALLLTFFALNQREEAEQKAREASARELASLSLRNLAVDPERSILLAMESVSKTYAFDGTTLPEAEDALHQALLAHRLVRTYKGTYPESCSGVIWCSAVAFSRDGHYLAISGEEDDVIIRDIEHPDSPLILTGHNGPVTDLSFGSTGDQLAVASANGDATIWKLSMLKDPSVSELSSGTIKRSVFSGHSGEIVAVDISPDGRLLATGSRDQLAKVWDIESGREVLSLDGHEGSVRDLAFSPDGRHLATASSDMTAIIWDIGTGDAVQVLEGHTDRLFGLDYSEDGEQLATASRDGSVVIWDLADNNDPVTIVSPGDHGGPVYAVAFSPDGRSLATAGVDATAKIWELPTGRRMLSLSGHEGTIYSLDFRPDGENLATGSIDNSVKIWDIRPEGSREWMTLDAHEKLVFDVVFSPDGGRIGSTSFDGTAKIWDTSTGEELIVLEGHQGPSSAIAFSPDQLLVATASFDGTAIVWDLDSSQPVAYLTGHQGPVNDVAFTRDGKEVVTAGFDGTARVWDARTGQELRQMIGHEGGIERVSVNPVEDQLATVGIDGTARVWQLSSGDEIGRLIGHQGPVLGLAYSMHGTQLVTTGADRSLKVWNLTALGDDVVSDKPIVINEVAYQLMGHTSDVWGVVSSPEQGMLATISFDGTARLWDISDPQHPNEHLVLGGWNDGREIAFSPDGKLLATTSSDGTIKVYVLPIEDLMDLAGERVTRGLSEEECRRYLHQEGCGASRQGES